MNDAKDGGFKWFGEGFDGFPRRLPEDCVEYSIFVVDPELKDVALRGRLRKIQQASNARAKKLLTEHIWQRDGISLELVREETRSFLRGRTNFGDSIEDEWLIVYMLRELSREFPEAWIKVNDTDGEFLLIEAANVLPKWLNPEVADNRVWINKGQLVLVPPTQAAGALSLSQGLDAISGDRSKLSHPRLLEEEAFYRLRNYPGQIGENLHHSLVRLPRKLAYIIHQIPASISQAIEAFYLRDPVALKPLRSEGGKLYFPPEDFTTARVKFTKVGFAQVKSQEFSAPLAWKQYESQSAKPDNFARAEVGMKVACGYEMLVSDPQNQDKKVVREIKLLLDDLDSGDEKLPTNEEIQTWGLQEDDETWLDVDFNDFENELSGRPGAKRDGKKSGFGDKSAHENLQKMVSRFEEFLKNDELEDMDEDDDQSNEDSEEEGPNNKGKEPEFKEDEFTTLIREMLGMSTETMQEIMGPHAVNATGLARDADKTSKEQLEKDIATAKAEEEQNQMNFEDDALDSEEEAHIKALSDQFEAELRRTGALSLADPFKDKSKAIRPPRITEVSEAGQSSLSGNQHEGDDGSLASDEDYLDEDYNLVENMLESFKSQAGTAGPGGNLLGMLGMKLPRDEGESGGDGKVSGVKGKGKAKQ